MVVCDDDGRLRAVHFWDHETTGSNAESPYGTKGIALEPARDPAGLTSRIDASFAGKLAAHRGERSPMA